MTLRSLLALLVLARAAGAQVVSPASPGAGDTAAARQPRRFDLRPALFVVAGTAALIPLDAPITRLARSGGPQGSAFLRSGARAFNVLGDPGAAIIAGSAFVVGRAIHSDHLADLGFHAVEALAVSGAATGLLKGISGRQRPYVDQSDPDEFQLGRGFGSGARTSFPSGHTTAAFAVASAVAAETRQWWPGAPAVVVPLLYGGAAMVGLARIYDARHWASDVALGAAIGTAAGRWVVERGHAPGSRASRRGRRRIAVLPAIGSAAVGIQF